MGCGVLAEGAMRGVGCARLRRAGEGAGAGERAERRGAGDSGAGRGGRQRSGEGQGQQREGTGQRDSIADGTALRCGRGGSRHFENL